MSFLSELKSGKQLKKVEESDRKDRSSANLKLAGKDVLDDEADRWEYFFNSGCGAWFDDIKEHTFTSTFCDLLQAEALIIVNHWEDRRRCISRIVSEGGDGDISHPAVVELFNTALADLQPLRKRLDIAVDAEAKLSPVAKAFVKLSTRSPKDSKKAFARAVESYRRRVEELTAAGAEAGPNTRWRVLCEETTASGAVASGSAALELLLDSERVYEDLEYALRGPPDVSEHEEREPRKLKWNMSLVARAWDPRLKPESEFRGICWGGKLTCLCQYFHPLYFPELVDQREAVERDINASFYNAKVQSAVARLGGHCIIDFAWLGPGEVIIIELNPFDGVCLGVFPASTGLFLWDTPEDRAVMKGEAPFEFRTRERELEPPALKAQCNPAWRDVVYCTA